MSSHRPPPDPLAGPRDKVARAREHLDTLEAAINQFLASKPYGTPHEFDAKSGLYLFKLEVRRDFPIRWGIIVGELLYDLRSALDQLLFQLFPGGRPKQPIFPIYDDEIDYLFHSRRVLKGIAPEAQDLIQAFQPYHAGDGAQDHTLFVLNAVRNADTHRVVHASYATTADEQPDIDVVFTDESPDGGAEVIYKPNVPLKDGAVTLRVRLIPATPEGDEPEVEVKGGIPIDVTFAERRLRLKDLRHMTDAVLDVIDLLAPHVPERTPPKKPRRRRT